MRRVTRRNGAVGTAILVIAAFAAAGGAAFAQSANTAGDHDWHFVAGLYGWMPAVSGTVTVRDFPEVPIEVPFKDIFDNLKFVLDGHFEAGKDRFGFGVNFLYVHERTPIQGEIPELLDASVNLRELIADGFGYYRLVQGSGECPWKLELMGGARFWNVNTRVESDLGLQGDGLTKNWVDGIGGLRVEIPLGPRFLVLGHGDVGAGGAKLDWSASGDIFFRLSKVANIGAGYRTLNVDLDKTGAVIADRRLVDISMHGPEVWLLFTW